MTGAIHQANSRSSNLCSMNLEEEVKYREPDKTPTPLGRPSFSESMSEKQKKFSSPNFDKRSSRTKGQLHAAAADDNILDENTDGGRSIPSHMMTSLDSQRHGNYFSTQTSQSGTTKSGGHPGGGGGGGAGLDSGGGSVFSLMNKQVDDGACASDSDESGASSDDEPTYSSKGSKRH